jgi:hypothetical protein
MQNLSGTVGIDMELEDSGALGAEGPFVVRTPGIAFDIDDLPVHRVDERGAAYRTIGAETWRYLGIFDS